MEIIDQYPSVTSTVYSHKVALSLGKLSIEQLQEQFSPAPEYKQFYTAEEAMDLCMTIVSSGKPNFAEKQIEVKSGYNLNVFWFLLQGYKKETLVNNGVCYGWQLGWTGNPALCGKVVPNHPNVENEYLLQTKDWFQDQDSKGMLVGPIKRERILWNNITTHPLYSVSKDEILGTRCMWVDASYVRPGTPSGVGSLNQEIPKGLYMGIHFQYNLPTVRDFVNDAIRIGLDKVKEF